MSRYSNDPYWTTARFISHCAHCKRSIIKGERIFYYPKGKTAFCSNDNCGISASNDFDAVRWDESVYCSQY